ncbi:DUF6284 family protein [Streptomyces xanthochromogenes]|uniref:Uncharacterized protein n=1 Tax=Streptomyces xanthochromogenes TaxID=67384 RepID=A0ABQ2ZXS5_9ACTN|nr:DUF6284 family protein [Streptomyces xanthochromogenes]GGY28233.1 hypothetical protein GCM10010326_22320 [Streptomyces xanthochromogenes]
MKYIAALQTAVTGTLPDIEPTDAELDAIVREEPLLLAEQELLDVQIALLDRPQTSLAKRRLRRAANKVLAARTEIANRAAAVRTGVAA